MKENEKNEESQVVQVQPINRNLPSLFLDTERFAQLQRACVALANSELVPDMYRITEKNPESKAIANCMIALDMAERLGANPLMVMQNLYIVYGKPSFSSSFLIATVNSCGRFTPLKFQFGEDGHIKETYKVYKRTSDNRSVDKTIDMANFTCYAYATERSTGAQLIGATVSIRMAFDENWVQKDGSKWVTMPKLMLMYRAASFWVRTNAPEISMGIYTVEENEDVQNAEVLSTSMNTRERVKVEVPIEDEEPPASSNVTSEASEEAPADNVNEKEIDPGY